MKTSDGATKMSDDRSGTSCEIDAFMLSVASHARDHASAGTFRGNLAASDPDAPKEDTFLALTKETVYARRKFPGNALLLAALMEEVGELARALLQRSGGEKVRAEAIQVASVALRICEEGDATFANVTDEQAKP